jgi:endonuclease YncB( thermonuclease family)
VVDGDTFWFRGAKIRIADIDTPELSPPRCERERQRGMAAKQRLLEILNSGPLAFKSTARDEDRFGRKLRVVYRGDRSVGHILVAEGLARRWEGSRRGWCD